MLHEILLSLWGCSTSVAEIIDADVSFHPENEFLIFFEVS